MGFWWRMKLRNKLVNKFQDFVWEHFIMIIADVFKIDCEYCWWWRGVLFGSLLTSLCFLVCLWAVQ